jgi:hypothetical protein
MTLLWKQARAGPATHAFVIGVGAYPWCKPGKGVQPELRKVADVPSAADSAKLMCDWLIEHKDELSAPLASLEVLIADAPQTKTKPYAWKSAGPVKAPTKANVIAAGKAWVKRLKLRPGDTALFYACGHGARRATKPMLLLHDLNQDEDVPWDAYLDLAATASSFQQINDIAAAVFLLDACQEASVNFELAPTKGGVTFTKPYDIFALDKTRQNVWLLSGASDGKLAYDGPWRHDEDVRIGRFTQTVQLALEGALVQERGNGWVVYTGGLADALKSLHRLRPEFNDRPFEPSVAIQPNEPIAITRPGQPRVPILVLTDPDSVMPECALGIWADPARTVCITERIAPDPHAWLAWAPASEAPHFACAIRAGQEHPRVVYPYRAIFDLRIPVK